MESLDRGEQPEPYFAIGFASMAQFLRIFTPRRWQALATLREQGPLTIAELARQLRRDYKNVHGDVEKLIEWQAIVKDEQGYISALRGCQKAVFIGYCAKAPVLWQQGR